MRPLLTFLFFLMLHPALAQEQRTIAHNGLQREYILYVPSELPQGTQPPLVFVLHGFTQTSSAIMGYSGFNALADAHGFVVVYANGVGNGWNTNSGFPGGSTADDVGFIGSLIDALHDELDIDTLRVYSCGFSAGGFMSHRLACELGHRIRAIAAVGGTMSSAAFNACEPAHPVPVLQIHGTSDAVVSYGGGFANVAVEAVMGLWAGRNGCPTVPAIETLPDLAADDGSAVERHVYGPCDTGADTELLKVVSGGHTWPGATATSGVGSTNRDISASEEIWAFFDRFRGNAGGLSSAPPLSPTPAVWPNPTFGPLHLPHGHDASLRWRVTDLSGRDVSHDVSGPTGGALDLGMLPSGIYLLHTQTAGMRHVERVALVRP